MPNKAKKIKVISAILVLTFFFENILWANPEIGGRRIGLGTLQVPSIFQSVNSNYYEKQLEAIFAFIAYATPDIREFNLRLTPKIGEKELELNFPEKYEKYGNLIVPCSVSSERSSRLYEAVITPDLSVYLQKPHTKQTPFSAKEPPLRKKLKQLKEKDAVPQAEDVAKRPLKRYPYLSPHENSLSIDRFDFNEWLFHVDKTKPWRNPNLIALWREAVREALAEDIGEDIADQLLVYPHGGILYEKWDEGDLDLIFYFNDWVYGTYGEKGLPYGRIANAFIKLADETGLSIVEELYNPDSAAKPTTKNDRFNQFPIHIRNNHGNEIVLDIHDAPLSYIDPAILNGDGGIGFTYDLQGNYFGKEELIEILNRYIRDIDPEQLIFVKMKAFVETAREMEIFIQKIREEYGSLSRIELWDFLRHEELYRKPFARVITLWRLVGRQDKVEESIRILEAIDEKVKSGSYRDSYELLEALEPYFVEFMENFSEGEHNKHFVEVAKEIRDRISKRLVREANGLLFKNLKKVIELHMEAHDGMKKDEELWKELWNEDEGIYKYAQTYHRYALDLIRRLKEHGYFKPGTKFADLGSGDGLMVHLVNIMAPDVQTCGIEKDFRLLRIAKNLTADLSDPERGKVESPLIDKERIEWRYGDYTNQDIRLSEFDVLYIYPPMREPDDVTVTVLKKGKYECVSDLELAVDIKPVIEKMKIGAIIVLHEGGRPDFFEDSPYLEYVPEIDAYKRVAKRNIISRIKSETRLILRNFKERFGFLPPLPLPLFACLGVLKWFFPYMGNLFGTTLSFTDAGMGGSSSFKDDEDGMADKEEPRTAMEILHDIMAYGLYENFDKIENPTYSRAQLVERLEQKVNEAGIRFPDKKGIHAMLVREVLGPMVSGEWDVFEAVVASVKDVTQKGGTDDYRLCYYDERKERLFVAREMLLGLPSIDLVAELIFRELAKSNLSILEVKSLFGENYTSEAKKKNDGFLEDHIKRLAAKRAIPHQLEEFIDLLLERSAFLLLLQNCKDPEDMELSKKRINECDTGTARIIEDIVRKNPRALKDFVEHFQKKAKEFREAPVSVDMFFGETSKSEYGTYVEIFELLKRMGIWAVMLRRLLKDMRMRMARNELKEFNYAFQDYCIIRDFLGDFVGDLDQWVIKERDLFLKEYGEFIGGIRDYVEAEFSAFKSSMESVSRNYGNLDAKHLAAALKEYGDIKNLPFFKEAKTARNNVKAIRAAFPERVHKTAMEVEMRKILEELSEKISVMDRESETARTRLQSRFEGESKDLPAAKPTAPDASKKADMPSREDLARQIHENLEAFQANFKDYSYNKIWYILVTLRKMAEDTIAGLQESPPVQNPEIPISYIDEIISIVENASRADPFSQDDITSEIAEAFDKTIAALRDVKGRIDRKPEIAPVKERDESPEASLLHMVFRIALPDLERVKKNLLDAETDQDKMEAGISLYAIKDEDAFRQHLDKRFLTDLFWVIWRKRYVEDQFGRAGDLGQLLKISSSLSPPYMLNERQLKLFENALLHGDIAERRIAISFYSTFSKPGLTDKKEIIKKLAEFREEKGATGSEAASAFRAIQNNSISIHNSYPGFLEQLSLLGWNVIECRAVLDHIQKYGVGLKDASLINAIRQNSYFESIALGLERLMELLQAANKSGSALNVAPLITLNAASDYSAFIEQLTGERPTLAESRRETVDMFLKYSEILKASDSNTSADKTNPKDPPRPQPPKPSAPDASRKSTEEGSRVEALGSMGEEPATESKPSEPIIGKEDTEEGTVPQNLRQIQNEEELIQNMLEEIVSICGLTDKKLALAFHKRLRGFESDKLRVLLRLLAELKEKEEFKNLLKNLIIIPSFTSEEVEENKENLSKQLKERGIDPTDGEHNIVFTFAPTTEKIPLEGMAIKQVRIDEGTNFNAQLYHYPLFEMVTIALVKYHHEYASNKIYEILKGLNIDLQNVNIDGFRDAENAFLIFTLIPKIERYEAGDRVEKYIRLMKAIKTAA